MEKTNKEVEEYIEKEIITINTEQEFEDTMDDLRGSFKANLKEFGLELIEVKDKDDYGYLSGTLNYIICKKEDRDKKIEEVKQLGFDIL